MNMQKNIHCIACSVFKEALERIKKEADINLTVDYIPSILHVRPDKLRDMVENKLSKTRNNTEMTILLLGECHANIQEQVKQHDIRYATGLNCAELLLGKEICRHLKREGAFFLMPEWTRYWRELFQQEPGFDDQVAKLLIQEMHTKFVYLKIGKHSIPRKALKEISEYCGLPVEIHELNPDILQNTVEELIEETMADGTELTSHHEMFAFQSMALDMVEEMLHQADNPEKLQSDIAVQMRGLTGADVVILIQFMDEYGGRGHEIASFEPNHRRNSIPSEAVDIMVHETRQYLRARMWSANTVSPSIHQLLNNMEFELSVAVPLNAGQKKVGCLLLLGLPDDHSLDVTLNVLDMFASILAFVFRNALLFRKQQRLIEKQTGVLREKDSRYRSLFENMLNAIACHQVVMDAQGRPVDYIFLEVNDMFEKLTGLHRADIIGKRVTDVIPGIRESTTNWIQLYGQVALEGKGIRLEQYDEIFKKWFSIAAYAPSEGFFTVIYEDITERKRSELLIRQSETKFRELLNSAGDAIFIQSLEGQFMDVNHAASEILGYSRTELMRMSPGEIEAGRNHLTDALRTDTIQKTGSMVFESEHRSKEGRIFPVEVKSRLIDFEGRPAILNVIRDISERKQQEKEIEQLLKQKEILLKEVYHRVKNNFMIISSLLHLQSSKLPDEYSKALFQESRDRVHTMALIHQQLYRSGDLASIDFKSYIQLLVKNLYRSYITEHARIDLIQDLEEIPVTVAKAIPCGLIINELITNALKYAFPEGRKGVIKITFRIEKPGWVRLMICDNGIGIPKEIKISHADSLGLKIVDMLTQQIRGKLIVRIHHGTCIRIIFPNPDAEYLKSP